MLGGQLAIRVCAKIYQPPDKPANPNAGPPPDAACVAPNANGTWCIGMVDGAACSAQAPFPQNDAWVWAEYTAGSSSSSSSSSSSGGFIYEVVKERFGGKKQANVPPCCP
jgi:hypothetical protein